MMRDYKPATRWHRDYRPSRRDYLLGALVTILLLLALGLMTDVPGVQL